MTAEDAAEIAEYLRHMLGAIQRIESYVSKLDFKSFHENTLVQDAVIRNFEIVGEAANKVRATDATFAQTNPKLRLEAAFRMRNALIHGYDAVNLVTIWNTIRVDLPALKENIVSAMDGL